MKYLLSICAFLFTITIGFSQQKPNVYFLKNDGEHVLKDSADIIVVVTPPDSGTVLYNVTEYYPKGQVKIIGKSSSTDPIVMEGLGISYWPNGRKKTIAHYKNNISIGEVFQFFENGQIQTVMEYGEPDTAQKEQAVPTQSILIKLCNDSTGKAFVTDGNGHYITGLTKKAEAGGESDIIDEEGDVKDGKRTGIWTGHYGSLSFTENYNDNLLISGKATDSAGTYTYRQRFISPQYMGGVTEFYRYLSRNIEYPTVEREKGIYGKVILSFIVSKNGTINKIKVLRRVTANIDREAVRVIAKSKNWLPGVMFGRQQSCSFTLPVSFTLK